MSGKKWKKKLPREQKKGERLEVGTSTGKRSLTNMEAEMEFEMQPVNLAKIGNEDNAKLEGEVAAVVAS